MRHLIQQISAAAATLAAAALLYPLPCLADGWTAKLDPEALPRLAFAADKGGMALLRIDTKNGTGRITRHDCIHGRVEGDKQKQGDLKTPEGVYFVTHKVKGPLDFMEYGPHAFALDYPNPVDRLRGKTGGGIWLHSKGRPIKGITTRGCLAVEQEIITGLVGTIVPGIPVIIAEHVEYGSSKPMKKAERPAMADEKADSSLHASTPPASTPQPAVRKSGTAVLKALADWSASLRSNPSAARSFYDFKRFTAAGGQNPKELVKRLSTDQLPKSEASINVFPGPGYTVTSWREPSGKGLHVLYWMPDSDGTPKIVGEKTIR